MSRPDSGAVSMIPGTSAWAHVALVPLADAGIERHRSAMSQVRAAAGAMGSAIGERRSRAVVCEGVGLAVAGSAVLSTLDVAPDLDLVMPVRLVLPSAPKSVMEFTGQVAEALLAGLTAACRAMEVSSRSGSPIRPVGVRLDANNARGRRAGKVAGIPAGPGPSFWTLGEIEAGLMKAGSLLKGSKAPLTLYHALCHADRFHILGIIDDPGDGLGPKWCDVMAEISVFARVDGGGLSPVEIDMNFGSLVYGLVFADQAAADLAIEHQRLCALAFPDRYDPSLHFHRADAAAVRNALRDGHGYKAMKRLILHWALRRDEANVALLRGELSTPQARVHTLATRLARLNDLAQRGLVPRDATARGVDSLTKAINESIAEVDLGAATVQSPEQAVAIAKDLDRSAAEMLRVRPGLVSDIPFGA
jgi:hypothetical protein